MLSTLAYTSRALIPAHSAEMLEIARASLRNNSRLGVTGALYFDGLRFYQVLEGDENVLACLFDTIRADPRHFDVQCVYHTPTPQRRFGDWSMKFVDGTSQPELATLFRGEIANAGGEQTGRIDALCAA